MSVSRKFITKSDFYIMLHCSLPRIKYFYYCKFFVDVMSADLFAFFDEMQNKLSDPRKS